MIIIEKAGQWKHCRNLLIWRKQNMPINVLVINVRAGLTNQYYFTAPAATYTTYEHERNFGYGSIGRSDIDIKHINIFWSHHQGFINFNGAQLISTIEKGHYDVVHFYFEDTTCIVRHRQLWDDIFSKALSRQNAYGIRSYIFTDYLANLLLHEVFTGLQQNPLLCRNNYVSEDFSQFCDDVRQCAYDQSHKSISQ